MNQQRRTADEELTAALKEQTDGEGAGADWLAKLDASRAQKEAPSGKAMPAGDDLARRLTEEEMDGAK